MRTHFIAIGGAAMHNLALALHNKGYHVTGSDDAIFEPSKSRLEKKGLLPAEEGWFPEKITTDIEAIILGMHAKADNPELLKAQELGLKIYSYPEFLYEQSKNKTRVVIGGSHGKTTITSMILHVMHYHNIEVDYMVGAQLEGFDTMVHLTEDNDFIVLEGDEYLSSPIDLTPKFHWYKPHIAVLSGIAWDHINVFPTFENYVQQFEIFIQKVEKGGKLFYYSGDEELQKLGAKYDFCSPYSAFPSEIIDNQTFLITPNGKVALQIFGAHNLQNLNAAYHICNQLGISDADFFTHISSFKGASKRLEKIAENTSSVAFKDFAHSPSKLKATTQAVKSQFAKRKLVACMELHTFSSLNPAFLKEYDGAMNAADEAIVFYSPKAVAHKKLPELKQEDVYQAFNRKDLKVFTDTQELQSYLKQKNWQDTNLLIMTSGNFEGMNIDQFGKDLIH